MKTIQLRLKDIPEVQLENAEYNIYYVKNCEDQRYCSGEYLLKVKNYVPRKIEEGIVRVDIANKESRHGLAYLFLDGRIQILRVRELTNKEAGYLDRISKVKVTDGVATKIIQKQRDK